MAVSTLYEFVKFFNKYAASRPALGSTQPPIQWVTGTLTVGLKGTEREADHSPPSSVEVNNAWRYTSTPPYIFMA